MSEEIIRYIQHNLLSKGRDDKGREIWAFKGESGGSKVETLAQVNLDSLEGVTRFFTNEGFGISVPRSITNPDGTTLFVSAGVQILEDVLHSNKKLEGDRRKFVAQPVFRTQFLGGANEFSSSSFVNLTTVIVDGTYEEHMQTLFSWLRFMNQLGLYSKDITLVTEETEAKWGAKKFKQQKIRIRYKDLSVGDATFIPSFPMGQSEMRISDIGFGLERLRALATGESYWNFIENTDEVENFNIIDSWNTLALLASSGVVPCNNERGYRFRKICKSLVEIIGFKDDTYFLFGSLLERWQKWMELPIPKDKAWELVIKEIHRNLNALVKLRLDNMGCTNLGVDINLPTDRYLKFMRGTGVKRGDLEAVLAGLNYKF